MSLSLTELPTKHHDLHELYSAVKIKSYLTESVTSQLCIDVKIEDGQRIGAPSVKTSLLEKLRPYQLDAVGWMVAKEKGKLCIICNR